MSTLFKKKLTSFVRRTALDVSSVIISSGCSCLAATLIASALELPFRPLQLCLLPTLASAGGESGEVITAVGELKSM